jgi:hypothetical protein
MSTTTNDTDLDDLLDDLIEIHTNTEILDSEELDALVLSYEKIQIEKEKHRERCRNYYDKHYKIQSNLSPARNAVILHNRALRKQYYQDYHKKRKNNIEK